MSDPKPQNSLAKPFLILLVALAIGLIIALAVLATIGDDVPSELTPDPTGEVGPQNPGN
jgi:C4-dicarboxylate transporter